MNRTNRGTAGGKPKRAAHLRNPESEPHIHNRTRLANRQERSQDYVETISDLIQKNGEARLTDIARRMGVTHVTVTKIVTRLERDGLVLRKPYRSIFLTDRGKKIADEARRRHDLVLQFLIALGVKPATAAVDAEGIEHYVSEDTLAVFEKFVRLRAKARSKGA